MAANVTVVREQGGDLLRVYSGGEIQVDSGATLDLNGTATLDGTLTVGTCTITPADAVGAAGSGVTASENGDFIHRTTLTVSKAVTMTDATTNGCHGTTPLYTFPQEVVTVLQCQTNLTLTAGSGGIGDTAAIVCGLGSDTVGTGNATITTTEGDIVGSTAATMTSGVGTFAGAGTVVQLNGIAAAKVMNLNIACPDADSSGNDTITVTGTVSFAWV